MDFYGGMRDLEARRIRCVGTAEERFKEDALRILRALRFAAQLDFESENLTWRAVRRLAESLSRISAERVQKELTLLLCSTNGGKIREAYEGGVTAVVLPELDLMMETPQKNPHHSDNVGEHCIQAMENINANQELDEKTFKKQRAILKWTMLLHDVGKPQVRTTDEDGIDHFYGHEAVSAQIARKVFSRLKFDNDTCKIAEQLILHHDYSFVLTEKAMRRAINQLGSELLPLLFRVERADIEAKNPKMISEKLLHLRMAQELYEQVQEKGDATSIKQLAVTGNDLLEAGMSQGKQVGDMLQTLLGLVMEVPERNNREWLLHYVKERLQG